MNRARLLVLGALAGMRTAHTGVLLLLAARSRRTTELWIGDSHAVSFNRKLTRSRLTRGAEGQFIWHLGPRIMYSLARNGFPASVHRVARLLARATPRGAIIPVFSAGEIDVRCHLVPRAADEGFSLAFVEEYVSQGCRVAVAMRADSALFAMPGPQSKDCPWIPGFPIRGSLADRTEMFRWMRRALTDAVDAYEGPVRPLLLDATDLLVDDELVLRGELNDDGVHTNELGVQLIRGRLHELEPFADTSL